MSDTYFVMTDAELASRISNPWNAIDLANALQERWNREHPKPGRHPATYVSLENLADPISQVIAKAVLANLCHPDRFHLCLSSFELYGQAFSVAEKLAESRTDDQARAYAVAIEVAERFGMPNFAPARARAAGGRS